MRAATRRDLEFLEACGRRVGPGTLAVVGWLRKCRAGFIPVVSTYYLFRICMYSSQFASKL